MKLLHSQVFRFHCLKENLILGCWPRISKILLEIAQRSCEVESLFVCMFGGLQNARVFLGGSDVDEITQHGRSSWKLFLFCNLRGRRHWTSHVKAWRPPSEQCYRAMGDDGMIYGSDYGDTESEGDYVGDDEDCVGYEDYVGDDEEVLAHQETLDISHKVPLRP